MNEKETKLRLYSIHCKKCGETIAIPSKNRKYFIKREGDVISSKDICLPNGKSVKDGDEILCSKKHRFGYVCLTSKGYLG